MGYFEEFEEKYYTKSKVIALACWYEDNIFKPSVNGEEYVELFDCRTKEWVRIGCHCIFNCMVLAMKQLKHTGVVSIVYLREKTQGGHEVVKYSDYEYDQSTDTVVCIDKYGSYSVPGERDYA